MESRPHTLDQSRSSHLLSALVDARGVILGRAVPAQRTTVLGDIVQPVDEVPFADWWTALVDQARQAAEARTAAFLSLAADKLIPVTVTAAAVPEYGAYLVSVCRLDFRFKPPSGELDQTNGQAVASVVTQILRQIHEQLAGMMPWDAVSLALVNTDTGGLAWYRTLPGGDCTSGRLASDPPELVSQVLHTRQSMLLEDVRREAVPVPLSVEGCETRALLLVPLVAHERPVGVLGMHSCAPDVYTPHDLRFLEAAANVLAPVLQNACVVERAASSLVQRYEQISALYELARQVTGKLDADEILHLVVRTLRRIFQCRACVIALREEADSSVIAIRAADGVQPHWRSTVRFHVGEGIAGQVVETGRPIYVPDIANAPDVQIFDPVVRSIIAVPIMFQGRAVGSLNLDSERVDAFEPEHERILTIAAAQVASALEIARLYGIEADRAQKLSDANLELARMEQLREELIQNLSHELRTPLTYIKGYIGLMQDEQLGPLEAQQADALQIVLDKAEAIQRLIADVVTLEGISESSLSQERWAVNDLAEQALTAASMVHAETALDFVLELDPHAGWVYVDRSRLNQALDNLLNNAIKFTPPGGQITLRTRRLPDGREVEISVSDTGIGIAPEYLERVFQRFYQVKDPARRSAVGSGIGLAIVQKVAQAHRGRVWVESEKGSGSHFMIVLPSLPEVPDDDGPEEGV